MHLALPTRKSSNPPPYAMRSSRFPMLRRSRVQAAVIFCCVLGLLFFVAPVLFGGWESIPSGTPPVVIVTVLDQAAHPKQYIESVKKNRIEYARKHGYDTFFPNATDYDLGGYPKSWTRVPAVRHALTKFGHSTYFWYLDQTALIMNLELKVEGHILNAKRLESLMLKNQPIVPPDSIIKTFTHLQGHNVDFVLTQDRDGISPASFIIRRGEWAKFFLDTWFDPLYRSYNFQKAETHALEHIVQWHPTILSKLALVPERTMNAHADLPTGEDLGNYEDGDFIVRFAGCEQPDRNCAAEANIFSKKQKNESRVA